MSTDVNMASASQPVTFRTQTAYPLPSQKFMIPTTWRRYQLSQLINKALGLDKTKPVPFDFLVRGELLTTTLSEWCKENGEETLEIEYIESVMPPQKMSDFPHEDWVSTVSCQIPGYFMTASYDGQVRAFDYSKNLVLGYAAHSAPVTSLCIVPSSSNGDGTFTIATASQDLTAQISEVTFASGSEASSSSSKTLATLHLHTQTVSSVSSNSTGSHLLTSSWDGLIGLWDTTIPTSDEVPEPALNERDREGKKKRRKLQRDAEDEHGGRQAKRKAPLMVLKSHTGRVSKAIWGQEDENKAYSCGFDSTVRLWDTEHGVCEHTINASEKPFLDLTTTSNGQSILAVSTDRTMSLYDIRSSPSKSNPLTSAASATFMHPTGATPSCISACESNAHQVVTGAYDGIVRVWDLRSTKGAMATFKAFEGENAGKKVLSVSWKRGIVGIAGEGGLSVWKVGEEKEDAGKTTTAA
ncbi:ribosome biogenesis protein YTM1 [Agrocybe pediades]|nr:ribosome biogenesis protein YTM1 [Agrocybe pediades]